MKKNIIVLLIVTMCLVLTTACGNKNNKKEEMQKMTLTDFREGTMTFYYPKSLSFSVKQIENEEEGNYLYVVSHDYSLRMNLLFNYDVTDDYNEMLETCKKSKAYREYTWNKYQGYACGYDDYVKIIVKLRENEIGIIHYFLGIFEMNNNVSGNVVKLFNEKGIQDWLNTMEYKK